MPRVLPHVRAIDKDTVSMFEEAFKQEPTNEDLGAQTFLANVRAGHWKAAQQVSYILRDLTRCIDPL